MSKFIAMAGLWDPFAGAAMPEMGHKQKWRCLAANQGDAEAQHNLGLLYAQGQGVPQEYAEVPSGFTSPLIKAALWHLSTTQGYQDAAENRDVVERNITSAQVAEAQGKWAEFHEDGSFEYAYELGAIPTVLRSTGRLVGSIN